MTGMDVYEGGLVGPPLDEHAPEPTDRVTPEVVRICEDHRCRRPAVWNVRTRRGENLDLCTAHKDRLVTQLVGWPTVTRLPSPPHVTSTSFAGHVEPVPDDLVPVGEPAPVAGIYRVGRRTITADLAVLRDRVERAHAEVAALCRGEARGGHRWRMSIPATPDRDSDILISDGLVVADALLGEVDRLRRERDALAAELDLDRTEYGGSCMCGSPKAKAHRTSRVVLAELVQKTPD